MNFIHMHQQIALQKKQAALRAGFVTD